MSVRTRTQGAIQSGSAHHFYSKCTSDGLSSFDEQLTPVIGPRSGVFKSTTDTHPSSWISTRKGGSYAIEPFISTTVTVSGGGNGFARTLNGVVCNTGSSSNAIWKDDFGHFFQPAFGSALPVEPTNLFNEVAYRNDAWLAADAQAKSSDVEGLVIIGELQETINMLRHPLQRSREVISRYRAKESKRLNLEDAAWSMLEKARSARNPERLEKLATSLLQRARGINPKGSRTTAKAASSAHLEFMFGIKPLMHDIEAIVRSLDRVRSVTQRYKASVNDTTSNTSYSTYNNGVDVMSLRTRVDQSILVKAGVAYRYEAETFNQKYGLSLNSIPTALWELVPLSFVVDWFYNIGNVIASAVPQSGSTYLGGYSTIIRDTTIHRDVVSHTSGQYWTVTRACQDWETVNFKTIHRIPEGQSYRLPRFRYTLNIGQVMSIISLITQRTL